MIGISQNNKASDRIMIWNICGYKILVALMNLVELGAAQPNLLVKFIIMRRGYECSEGFNEGDVTQVSGGSFILSIFRTIFYQIKRREIWFMWRLNLAESHSWGLAGWQSEISLSSLQDYQVGNWERKIDFYLNFNIS